MRARLIVTLFVAMIAQVGEARNWNKPDPLTVDMSPISFLGPSSSHEKCHSKGGSYQFESVQAEFVTSNYNRELRSLKKSIQDVLALMLNPLTRNDSEFQVFLADFVKHLDEGNFRGVRDRQSNLTSQDKYADGKGTSDPAYGAQSLLLNVAKLVSLADALDLWSSEMQRSTVIQWGNNLQQESHPDRRGRPYREQGNDNVAMRAMSYLAWSLVSGVSSLREEAERAFESTLNRLNSDGSMTDWLEVKHRAYRKHLAFKEDDKAVGYLIVAAHYASFMGADWYSKKSRNGKSLDDAVAWLIKAHTDPESTSQASRLRDQAKIDSGMKLGDWAWTAVYVANRSDTSAGKRLNKLAKQYEGFGYWNKHLGYTSCYYGYIGDGKTQAKAGTHPNAPLQLNTSKGEACSDPTFAALMGDSCK